MRWPPYDHIFFDCDSTLTTIEGIDILAESAGKQWRVEVLTRAAMDGELDLSEVYERRLRAVKPTQNQIRDIRRAYKKNPVEDARAVIGALQELGLQVYIVSGGLLEPVREFGLFLGVPKEHIRAVGVTYDELSGHWWIGDDQRYLDYEEGALTVSDGKAEIVRQLLAGKMGRSLLVGDGISDLLASGAVDRFVGFGGVVSRDKVREEAPLFIQSQSLAPLLAAAAGPASLRRLLDTPYEALGDKAWDLIHHGAICFNDKRLERKFNEAVNTARHAYYARQDAPADSGGANALDDWTAGGGVY